MSFCLDIKEVEERLLRQQIADGDPEGGHVAEDAMLKWFINALAAPCTCLFFNKQICQNNYKIMAKLIDDYLKTDRTRWFA
ncbi:MAG TPA: hypothetical protein VMW36_00490 [Patescibacteria group bacterium]|nr:hypothetical protein [Patescibacteria group bacterium]